MGAEFWQPNEEMTDDMIQAFEEFVISSTNNNGNSMAGLMPHGPSGPQYGNGGLG